MIAIDGNGVALVVLTSVLGVCLLGCATALVILAFRRANDISVGTRIAQSIVEAWENGRNSALGGHADSAASMPRNLRLEPTDDDPMDPEGDRPAYGPMPDEPVTVAEVGRA